MVRVTFDVYSPYIRVHTLLYEEVVAHPQQAAARLLSWCGLPWEEGVLSFHTSPTSRDRPVLTASAAQVRERGCSGCFHEADACQILY
jgi:hypothetical protein